MLKERFVILVVGKIILVNAYFPSPQADDFYNATNDMLSEIDTVIKSLQGHHVMLAADFNVDLNSSHRAVTIYKNFFSSLDLCVCDNRLSKNPNILNYTFKHDSLNRSSYIDFFVVSKSLLDKVTDFDIIDSGINLSDHNPILLSICLDDDLLSVAKTKSL